jgi:hypothetical protein
MKLPDRPVLNGILAVLCALVVLGVLSTPAIVGQQAPSFSSKNPASSNSAGYVSNSSNMSPSIPTTSFTVTNLSFSNSSSNVPAGQTLASVPSHSSQNNQTFQSSSSSNATGPASPSPALQGNTTVTTTETAIAPTTNTELQSQSFQSSSSSPSAPSLTQSAGTKLSSQTLQTFGILSISAIVIALGSMFFVYRRVGREDSLDE